jgi:hypothetical protein
MAVSLNGITPHVVHGWFMCWSLPGHPDRLRCRRSDMTNIRIRHGALLSLVVGSSVLSCRFSSTAGATSVESTMSAGQLLKAAIASATKEGSVRVTVRFFSGKVTGKLVQDSSSKMAEQTVAIGKERASIVLSGGEAFISGNAQGLTSYFGVPKAAAGGLLGHWISVSPTDSGFQSVTAGLTLASALSEVSPTGSISKGKKKTVNGNLAISIAGIKKASGTRVLLFVSQTRQHLPVEAVESSGSGATASGEIVTFTRWAEKVHVPTLSGSIPISTLNESPAGG